MIIPAKVYFEHLVKLDKGLGRKAEMTNYNEEHTSIMYRKFL